MFTRGADSLKRAVESFSTTLYEGAVQPSDICLSLLSNSTNRHVIVCRCLSPQGCDFQKLLLKIWLVLRQKKTEETFAMVLSLQGLYNSFICLLNKYIHTIYTHCKGLTNVTFEESYLLA